MTAVDVFNNMSDKDLELIMKADKLHEFCLAVSLDLNTKPNEKSTAYTA